MRKRRAGVAVPEPDGITESCIRGFDVGEVINEEFHDDDVGFVARDEMGENSSLLVRTVSRDTKIEHLVPGLSLDEPGPYLVGGETVATSERIASHKDPTHTRGASQRRQWTRKARTVPNDLVVITKPPQMSVAIGSECPSEFGTGYQAGSLTPPRDLLRLEPTADRVESDQRSPADG